MSLLSTIGHYDELLTEALRQTVTRPVLEFFFAITQLGNFETLMAIGAVVALLLLIRRRWLELSAWIIATAGNGLLNRLMKNLFQRARPLHEHGLVLEQGWSFPSGHASGSMAVYGMLAYLLLRSLPPSARLPLLLLTAALILMIGCSRVILQVHFASDVIAGFLTAGLWLALCICVTERARRRAAPVSRRTDTET